MNRREFLRRAALGAAGITCASALKEYCVNASERPEKPNFVFILMDDMGWRDLGCYGNTFTETPEIDRLALQGMSFSQAYAACPVCSPTRASIMTGKRPVRVGITDWIPGRASRPEERLLAPPIRNELALEEITIAEALKPAGYTSALIGKWHLGGTGFLPQDQGFDVNIGGCDAGATRSYFYPGWYPRIPVPGKDGDYLTDNLSQEAVKFVESNRGRPFALFLCHYAPHTPLQAKEDLIRKYEAKGGAGNPVYSAMLDSVDQGVGKIMRKLDELGIADRTVVIFTSDNGGLCTVEGPNTPATRNSPLRDGKGYLYEGGIRVPLIVRWPGVTKAGSECAVPVCSIDFFPTMCEIAGTKTDKGDAIDGVSIVSLLKGSKKLRRDTFYWHYPHYPNQGATPGAAIRKGDYKLIRFYEDQHVELYNIAKDVGEKNDLAAKMPDKVAELRKLLDDWLKETRAKMPTPNPNYKPNPASGK